MADSMNVGVHIPADFALGNAFGRIPTDLPLHSLHPNGSLWDPVVRRFVYSGVYRLDDALAPVPDLAEEPCAISADLLLVTCVIRDATFHDGTPVTADDVAFTYQLLISGACRMPLLCAAEGSLLEAARAIDQRTVEFRLSGPDPAFITSVLPEVLIEPRDRIESAFAEFTDASGGADAASLEAAAARLDQALRPEDPARPGEVLECDSPEEIVLAEAETVIAEIPRELRSRDAYGVGAGGAFDTCAYGDYLVRVLTDTADALTMTGVDAIAAAYRILEFPAIPVGSGPWRVLSIDPGVSMELASFDAFHRGVPASPRMDLRLIRSTAEAVDAVRSGAIDWLVDPFPSLENFIAEGIGDAAGVAWVEYLRLGYTGLHYNLREGRLFADQNLREAIELCVDKEETVAAATGGTGAPIYSPISPSMWAYEPNLEVPERDVAAARERIEESGWTMGDDGIYHKGEQRLATVLHVRDDQQQWIRFVELLAVQVADCGIEITPQQVPFDDFIVALDWPLEVAGVDEQWDAVLAGWITSPDPDFSGIFHSREITTPSKPAAFNYMGYSSAESDSLLDRGRATYDQRERARIYREWQEVLAEDRPVLFAWSALIREPRSDRLESTIGPLETDTSTWWWELETLFVRSSDP
jgi:ABC-type transport system substrate-binding protein